MTIKSIASNMTELDLGDGTKVLFSYQTPVACTFVNGQTFRTSYKWSATTTRHINKWLGLLGDKVEEAQLKPQEFFNDLVNLSKEVA